MKINRLLLSAIGGLLLAGAATAAHAETVTYSTTGMFASDSSSSINVGGGMSISFAGLTNNSVSVPPPSNAGLGDFVVAYDNVGSGISGPINDTFTLTLTQSAPTIGTGSFSALVTGSITSMSSGTAAIFFSSPTFVLGNVTYNLATTFIPLVAPTTNNGHTSIEAQITASVPSPASAIAGSALLGLLAAGKVRSRKNSI